MTVSGKKRLRSARWWGVFCCALLFVGTYVVFDLLDLDGSELRRSATRDLIVAAESEARAERFFRTDLATPLSIQLIAPGPSRLPSLDICIASALSRLRLVRRLPRLHLTAEASSSRPADPVSHA